MERTCYDQLCEGLEPRHAMQYRVVSDGVHYQIQATIPTHRGSRRVMLSRDTVGTPEQWASLDAAQSVADAMRILDEADARGFSPVE